MSVIIIGIICVAWIVIDVILKLKEEKEYIKKYGGFHGIDYMGRF